MEGEIVLLNCKFPLHFSFLTFQRTSPGFFFRKCVPLLIRTYLAEHSKHIFFISSVSATMAVREKMYYCNSSCSSAVCHLCFITPSLDKEINSNIIPPCFVLKNNRRFYYPC